MNPMTDIPIVSTKGFDPARYRARKTAPCDRCGATIAVGDYYVAGRAKVFGWKTRFGVEHICLECAG